MHPLQCRCGRRGCSTTTTTKTKGEDRGVGCGVAAEAALYQLGDFGPQGEQPSYTPGGSAGIHLENAMKTVKPPVLEEEKYFESWKTELSVYVKLNKFGRVVFQDLYCISTYIGSVENSKRFFDGSGGARVMYGDHMAVFLRANQTLNLGVAMLTLQTHAVFLPCVTMRTTPKGNPTTCSDPARDLFLVAGQAEGSSNAHSRPLSIVGSAAAVS